MFWEVELTQKVRIHPNSLASDITTTTINQELRNTVEGSVTPNNGIILLVKNIISVGSGIVSFRTGYALFDVRYNAVVFHPRKGQIVDAVITSVIEHGFLATAGPLELFVSKRLIPEWYSYDANNSSFVPVVGQATTNSQGKLTVLGANDVRKNYILAAKTKIRVKIVNTKPHSDSTKLVATGNINDEFLGFIN